MANDLRFSQNFLHDSRLVEKLVKLAEIQPGDTVLEIGPGRGIITEALARQVTGSGRVAAAELDPVLTAHLQERFRQMPQVEIVAKDIREMNLHQLIPDSLVFSNVPFAITSEILELLFTAQYKPRRAYLILQTDALISSSPYGDGETFKSLLIQPRYRTAVVHHFSPSDFSPPPSVHTALFSFERLPQPLIAAEHYDLYKDFLAFVSKDRVGEGVWMRIFSKPQLQRLTADSPLVAGRGIKSQPVAGMVAAFQFFQTLKPKYALVQGAMNALREEQQRREQINKAGGHHRSKSVQREKGPSISRKPR